MKAANYLELVCPAGSLTALRTAVDAGADTVYCGWRDCTNARNYPGMNFDVAEMKEGVAYAHAQDRSVLVAINTFPRAGEVEHWHRAVDNAVECGADAVIFADIGVLAYAAKTHPQLRRHLSVQAGASNPLSIDYYREQFGISRVVLPRILAIEEVAGLISRMKVEAEVFAFGSVGTMVEGRCILSSYITGRSPSSDGVCAPAEFVSYREDGEQVVSCLGKVTMNRYEKHENAAYPTPCKCRLVTNGAPSYLFEEPVGLNAVSILPQLKAAGVTAIKIEGRQRSKAYVGQVVSAFRQVLDALARGESLPRAAEELSEIAEGGRTHLSAFKKGWR